MSVFKPRIKCCGMTQLPQVNQLIDIGVHFAGFIFYNKSPRYVLRQLHKHEIKDIKQITKVGVFVNETVEEVLRIVDDCRLHMVQLHGDETPKYCEKIADYVGVIKAIRVTDDDNINWRIKDYTECCDMVLFDKGKSITGQPTQYGGTGEKINWQQIQDAQVAKPYMLSGGIQPTDVHALHQFALHPHNAALTAIDINSRFEITAGIKDMQLVETFVKQLYSHT
jgi:phosphoribosylanthranilate isomerase